MIDIDALSWNLSIERQQSNIARMRIECDSEIEMLIMPYRKQDCWENCAVLLSKLDDETIVRFLPKLLEWYKDLNWPGIDIISKRIAVLPAEHIRKALAFALCEAKSEHDEEWIENLHTVFDVNGNFR